MTDGSDDRSIASEGARYPGGAGADTPAPPQYGQYATPAEQQARIAQPDASSILEAGQSLQAAPAYGESASRSPRKAESAAAARVSSAHAGVIPATPRPIDRVVTALLLAYGLFTVISSAVQLMNFPAFAQTWMAAVRIDAEFTNIAQGRQWGIIGAIVFAVIWLLTALICVRRIMKGRRAWWIPLVGAAVGYVSLALCLAVPLIGDPAIAAYFTRSG